MPSAAECAHRGPDGAGARPTAGRTRDGDLRQRRR